MAAQFPEGFLWSTATASHQIEGGWNEDSKGESVWDRFSHTPGKIANNETGDVACDHYHRWRDDVALMKSLGLNAYRFSVSWPRVLPEGTGRVNEAGVRFYGELVDALLAAGIRPLVTLYHWDHPQSLEDRGGWVSRDSANWFADYAALLASRLGDRVKDWITLNEPASFIYGGHVQGTMAPGRNNRAEGFGAAHNANRAHGLAGRALKANGGAGTRVGTALNLLSVDPATDSPADVAAADRLRAKKNLIFLEPITRGEYSPLVHDTIPQLKQWVRAGDLEQCRGPLDFLGVNYYHHLIARETPAAAPAGDGQAQVLYAALPGEAAEVQTRPQMLRRMLNELRNDYGIGEIIITENGLGSKDDAVVDGRCADPKRQGFIRDHLAAVLDAINDGVNVAGYCAWSLMDNFEWAFGYGIRFGIVHTDYATQRRTVKDSGRWYSRCAKANALVE